MSTDLLATLLAYLITAALCALPIAWGVRWAIKPITLQLKGMRIDATKRAEDRAKIEAANEGELRREARLKTLAVRVIKVLLVSATMESVHSSYIIQLANAVIKADFYGVDYEAQYPYSITVGISSDPELGGEMLNRLMGIISEASKVRALPYADVTEV